MESSAYDINSDNDDSLTEDFTKRKLSRKVNADAPKSTSANPTNKTSDQHVHSIGYVFSKELIFRCNKMVQISGRAYLVHSLLESYGLFQHLQLLPLTLATFEDLTSFHDSSYVKYLQGLNDEDEDIDVDEEGELFGLMYDCPPVQRTYDFVRLCVGASLTAARALTNFKCKIAINWMGGWHHAQRDQAAGFCYANDIVIAILELKKVFNRVLYVDLDLHHGDGVQEAFRHTDSVLTISFHKFEAGFFPGTGSLEEEGFERGKHACLNVPFKNGIQDEKYVRIFQKIMFPVLSQYDPHAIVIQCGADCISGDPHQAFNLTPNAIEQCLKFIFENSSVPVLLLGGGGYNHVNTAKCWTRLTACVLNTEIPEDIPDCCTRFEKFGPDFTVNVTPSFIKDENTDSSLEFIVKTVIAKLGKKSL